MAVATQSTIPTGPEADLMDIDIDMDIDDAGPAIGDDLFSLEVRFLTSPSSHSVHAHICLGGRRAFVCPLRCPHRRLIEYNTGHLHRRSRTGTSME